MLITTSLAGIAATEEWRFVESEYPKTARLIGIVFCRPDLPLMKTEIIPSLPYFHFRSGHNTAFYFGGFENDPDCAYGLENRPGPVMDEKTYTEISGPEGRQWYFVPQSFNRFRAEVEQRTRWRYSGGCDMILMNSKYDPQQEEFFRCGLDFSGCILLQLDRLNEIPSMPSVSHVFERIFQYAENQDPNDPTWGFSDFAGLNLARSGLWQVIIGLLPQGLRATAKAACQLAVQNVALPVHS